MVTGYVFGAIGFLMFLALNGFVGYWIDEDGTQLGGVIFGFFSGIIIAVMTAEFKAFNSGWVAAMCTVFVGAIVTILLNFTDAAFYNDHFLLIAEAIIVVLMIVALVFGGIHVHKKENMVLLPEPEIIETRYDILGGGDSSRVSGALYRARGKVEENECFKLYYEEERNGEYIAVPMLIPENKTTVVVLKDSGVEHAIKIEKIFYLEDRNVDPYEVSVDHVEVSYKLYVNEATFTGLQFDGN